MTILGSKRRLDECMVTRGTSATALDSSCLIEDAAVFHPGSIKTFRIRGPDVGTILTIVVEVRRLNAHVKNLRVTENETRLLRILIDSVCIYVCFPD